jgi:hypothetical protein
MRYGIARFAARGAGARRALLALPLALRIGPRRKTQIRCLFCQSALKFLNR